MKQEFNPTFLYVNSLFKTTEYKLDTDNNIHIHELTSSGSSKKIISLDTIESAPVLTDKTIPTLLFLLGSASAITLGFFNSKYDIGTLNVLTIVSILTTFIAAVLIIAKSEENHIYVDSFTNKTLFKFRQINRNQSDINNFVKLLDKKITVAKNSNISDINETEFSAQQRNLNLKHLDSLYNLGLVDEVSYKRISNNINKDLTGDIDARPLADVIYLPIAN